LFILLCLFFINPTTSYAVEDEHANIVKEFKNNHTSSITYDENGGYFVEETLLSPSLDGPSLFAKAISPNKISKSKQIKYYNSKNELCWHYSLTASFKLNNKNNAATYLSSNASVKVFISKWKMVSEKHTGKNNTAKGTVKMNCDNIHITKTITIKCN